MQALRVQNCHQRTARPPPAQLPVHPLLQQPWCKVKSSTWPRDHRVEGLAPSNWGQDGEDGSIYCLLELDRSVAAASPLDSSLPQDPASRPRLEQSRHDGLTRMAGSSRELMVVLVQMPHSGGRHIELGGRDDIASCSCPKQSLRSSTKSPRRQYLGP